MKNSQKNILLAFILNFVFTIIEAIGGIITNSIAIISDSVHDFGDCIAVGLAFILGKKSEKKADRTFTYGYARYALVSALITNMILIIGSCFVVMNAIDRLINPQKVISIVMIWLAVAGLLVHGIAVLKTRHSKHINEKSINLHMLEDMLGWAVVLIGSLFIHFFNWTFLDPILSLLVVAYVLFNVIKNIHTVFNVILERTPKNFDLTGFETKVKTVDGVTDCHHIHIWTLDGNTLLGTAHVIVDKKTTLQEWRHIRKCISEAAKDFNVLHFTVELESRNNGDLDKECHSEFEIENSEHS
jgi:cobalt-zinc-cadmium efflux system protein